MKKPTTRKRKTKRTRSTTRVDRSRSKRCGLDSVIFNMKRQLTECKKRGSKRVCYSQHNLETLIAELDSVKNKINGVKEKPQQKKHYRKSKLTKNQTTWKNFKKGGLELLLSLIGSYFFIRYIIFNNSIDEFKQALSYICIPNPFL